MAKRVTKYFKTEKKIIPYKDALGPEIFKKKREKKNKLYVAI